MTSRSASYNASTLDAYADQLAGQIYLPDEQCEIIDGEGSYLCRVRSGALLSNIIHGVQRRMVSVDNFFVFFRLICFALLLLYIAFLKC